MAKRKAKGLDDAFTQMFGAMSEAQLETLCNEAHTKALARGAMLWALVDDGAHCAVCGGDLSSQVGICAWRDNPAHKHCVIRASLPVCVLPCVYGRHGMLSPWE